jgi:hypothetical protein
MTMNKHYLVKVGATLYRLHGQSPEEALTKLKKAANDYRAGEGRHGTLKIPGDFGIGFTHSPDIESLTVDDLIPDTFYEAVRLAGCGRCGGELESTERGLKCPRCGARPCSVEDGDWHVCGRCLTPTMGRCFGQCEGCDHWDEQYEEEDPKAAARMLAWEELGERAAAGLSTDGLAKKYGLDE